MHQPDRLPAAADRQFVAGAELGDKLAVRAQNRRGRQTDGFDANGKTSGKISGRFDSVCGQTGVSANTSAVGKTIAPPADSE